ncbi:hypothetical protein DVH05_027933 [Phytophthora capsici]|nr:hypothetical protein DVH05_027933 [Phytophthora capsici]
MSASVPEYTVDSIPYTTELVPDSGQLATPEVADDEPQAPHQRGGRLAGAVTLTDFASEDFMTLLRRDRLFERIDDEDLNLGGGDWLLPLDSDTEGDEDTVPMD